MYDNSAIIHITKGLKIKERSFEIIRVRRKVSIAERKKEGEETFTQSLSSLSKENVSIITYLWLGTGNPCAGQRSGSVPSVRTVRPFMLLTEGNFGLTLPTGSEARREGRKERWKTSRRDTYLNTRAG